MKTFAQVLAGLLGAIAGAVIFMWSELANWVIEIARCGRLQEDTSPCPRDNMAAVFPFFFCAGVGAAAGAALAVAVVRLLHRVVAKH